MSANTYKVLMSGQDPLFLKSLDDLDTIITRWLDGRAAYDALEDAFEADMVKYNRELERQDELGLKDEPRRPQRISLTRDNLLIFDDGAVLLGLILGIQKTT